MQALSTFDLDSRIRKASELELTTRAKRMRNTPCCEKRCVKSLPPDCGFQIARGCIEELSGTAQAEKKIYMLEKVRGCIKRAHDVSGYLSFSWKVGVAPRQCAINVCRTCFLNFYECSHGYIESIIRDIKGGVRSYDRLSSAATGRVDSKFTSHLERLASHHGVTLTREQIQAMTVPNSVATLSAFAWLHNFFDTVGEKQPTISEIHLDPCTVTDIYKEYKQVIEDAGEDNVSYNQLIVLWRECFPHVKIREYKAVTGKCQTCTMLSAAKRKKLDRATRKYLNELTALHRSFYMGERIQYYSRRNDAMLTPSQFLSIIADGMQQAHCLLPWMGNMYQFGNYLQQHIQGVVIHGRNIKMYRTFHNVKNNANLSIHCLLKALETVKQEEGRLPDVVYYQMDGGSENVADHVLALCSLVVAKGLTKKIVITRLPVGHTHEDIDSKFAFIWKRVRNSFVLTPHAYRHAIEGCLSNSRVKCEVVDIFAVPNYEKYIRDYIIPDFGRYAKLGRNGNDWTQLQFIFESVPVSANFRCGVKTTYRKYSADVVILIQEDGESFSVRDAEVRTYPAATADHPEGFSLLTSLPSSDIVFEPDAFVLGSRAVLDTVVSKVRKFFEKSQPDIAAEWDLFVLECPASDCVQEYCQSHPLDIPLKEILFSNATVDRNIAIPGMARGTRQRVVCADSVNFRKPGRRAAATPFVEHAEQQQPPEEVGALPERRRDRADSSSDSDASEEIMRFVDVGAACSSSSVEATYLSRVGMEFDDIDDDITFIIDSVCREDKIHHRKSFAKLYFKYHDVEQPGEFEYTPCIEVLNSTWCRWKPTASSSAREQRAANRMAAPPTCRTREEDAPHSVKRMKRK